MSVGSRGTDAGRAWWWGVLRTERDRRLAAQRGWPITAPNLRRLLERRLGGVWGRVKRDVLLLERVGNMQFDDAMAALTGHKPFPWQRRLYDRFVAGDIGVAVTQLDIPTGLGKTSVIPTWLLAHLLGEGQRPPMRLVYVVNRRTIVDQATRIAETCRDRLRDHSLFGQAGKQLLGEQELAVSALRGALADNRQWMSAPHRPAIIVGTVDLIGSRLLFGAYRAGRWSKAQHAGLIGQDTLIVHDEAHLSQPFQKLLDWVKDRQGGQEGSPRPMRMLAMSATGGESSPDSVLTLGDADRAEPAVRQRIHAGKRLVIHEPAEKIDLPRLLAELAVKAAGKTPLRVIVFVRRPDTAKAVVGELVGRHKIGSDRVALLTGTIRGYERDELVDTPTLKHLLRDPKAGALTESLFLVSTSAGEVGADFDADHLVCDATTLDAMIQRLGRMNRRGESNARVDVVADVRADDKKTVNARQMSDTIAWLKRLPHFGDDPGVLDASPQALRDLQHGDREAYLSAIAPPPQAVPLHPFALDALALTSIQDDWELVPSLDEFLHGVGEYEPPRTTVAWREEIRHFFPTTDTSAEPYQNNATDPDDRLKSFEDWLDACSLRPRETLSERSERVIELLQAIRDRGTQQQMPMPVFVRLRQGQTNSYSVSAFLDEVPDDKQQLRKFLDEEMADATFILPTTAGGCDGKGMLNPEYAEPVQDRADRPHVSPTEPTSPERLRIWLKPTDKGWQADALGQTPFHWQQNAEEPSGKPGPAIGAVRTRVRDLLGLHLTRRFTLKFAAADRTQGVLLLFKPPPAKSGNSEQKVPLQDHCHSVESHARDIAVRLGLDEPLVRAFTLAGEWHDSGKGRPLWQRSIRNEGNDPPLAKSFKAGLDPSVLRRYRHEYGSLVDAVTQPDFQTLTAHGKDLALHLIAAHHGRGRPFFPAGAFDPDSEFDTPPDCLTPAEIARRYARLQRQYGHWGLAWLESLLMCADQAASRGEEPEDVQ